MVLFRIYFIGETCFLCLLNCAYFLSSVMLPTISAQSGRVGFVVTVAVGWVTFLGANLITFELLYYFLSPHSPHILNLVLPVAVPSAGCNELVLCAYKPCLMMLDWIVLGSLQSAILDSTAKSATTQRSAASPPAFHLSAGHCDQPFQPWSTEWSWV